jgi:hypothetical protein
MRKPQQIRLCAKVYAVPELYYHIGLIPDADNLVPISPGTVGEVLSQFTHELTGITVTTVQFGDLYADIGPTTWEPFE